MSELKPGKGVFTDLTQRNLDFLYDTFFQPDEKDGKDVCIADVYSDSQHEADAKSIINRLKAASVAGWIDGGSDDFGTKVYREIQVAKGMLRCTVILTKKGELKLDIRTWYEG